jgi:protein-disulfide isomerase
MFTRALAAAAVCLFLSPALAQAPTSPSSPDRAAIEKIVREYLLKNPEVLVEAMDELRRRQEVAASEASKQAIGAYRKDLLEDEATPVGGNVKGDVTLVEFFDYHCGYCKQVHEPMQTLMREDKNLRVVYKEMPILSPESRIAAAGALAARKQGKYVEMHNALMSARGKLTKDRVLAVAKEQKLDVAKLEKDMELPEIQAALNRNLQLAQQLGVDGTPAFIIGDQFAPGALPIEQLRAMVAQARKK